MTVGLPGCRHNKDTSCLIVIHAYTTVRYNKKVRSIAAQIVENIHTVSFTKWPQGSERSQNTLEIYSPEFSPMKIAVTATVITNTLQRRSMRIANHRLHDKTIKKAWVFSSWYLTRQIDCKAYINLRYETDSTKSCAVTMEKMGLYISSPPQRKWFTLCHIMNPLLTKLMRLR